MTEKEKQIYEVIKEAALLYEEHYGKAIFNGGHFSNKTYLPLQFNFWREVECIDYHRWGIWWKCEFLPVESERHTAKYFLRGNHARRLYHSVQINNADDVTDYIRQIQNVIYNNDNRANTFSNINAS